MSRTDGRKLVAVAGTAIVGALGFATIYLPFVADRGMLWIKVSYFGLICTKDNFIFYTQQINYVDFLRRVKSQYPKEQDVRFRQ
jgi:hypothetical protein